MPKLPDNEAWDHDPEQLESKLSVYPTENEPKPAIYGPKGEVLRWKQRAIGFTSQKNKNG